MEVLLKPELEAKLDQLASETGRSKSDFVEAALEGYLDELLQIRQTLDRRYDDLISGRVKAIPGDEAFARLMAKMPLYPLRAHDQAWAAS
jgi:predicted DNA-binding protein